MSILITKKVFTFHCPTMFDPPVLGRVRKCDSSFPNPQPLIPARNRSLESSLFIRDEARQWDPSLLPYTQGKNRRIFPQLWTCLMGA